MVEKTKARIMDATRIRRVLARVATEIIERNRSLKNLVIVAVKPRGLAVGRRIARSIKELEGVDVPAGLLGLDPLQPQDLVTLIEEVAPELVFGQRF